MYRSYLFVPGTKPRMIEKAMLSNADSVIIDVEDAVAASEKETARQIIKEALCANGNKKPVFVRINAVSTDFWEEDVSCALKHGASGIVVPKVESELEINKLCNLIAESRHRADNFEIIPLIETALGIQYAYQIAKSDKRITRLAFGSLDFASDIGCQLTKEGLELLFARSQLVIASRAAGLGFPIDAVYPDFKNNEGLAYEAENAKKLGFKGKLIIHPNQIDTVNGIFSPTEKEIEYAERIVEQFEAAVRRNDPVLEVDGKMVDFPVYKQAKDLLTRME